MMEINNQYKFYKQIFLGQDGNKILLGVPDNFGIYFDWQIAFPNIYKKNNHPRTVYLKTDFLREFVKFILPSINNEFILITACSDLSPQISFPNEYDTLIHDQRVKHWYMNNMRYKNNKVSSLPCGIAAGKYWDNCTPEEVDKVICTTIDNTDVKNKKDKVFCSFREAYFNVCGNDMFIRPKISEIINKKEYKDIFDVYSNNMQFREFLKTLSEYKYALIPHGNGMDPNPTAWLALALKTIPVIYKTPNSIDMFKDKDCVIYFENFEDITNKNLYIEKQPVDFEFLTMQYWANKINNHNNMDELTTIGNKCGTDKAWYHFFTVEYEKVLSKYRNDKLNILEIGVYYGSSLRMWKQYFPNAQIYGIDVVPSFLINKEDRIHVEFCDQTNKAALEVVYKGIIFDIIIDDGGHTMKQQQTSIGPLFKRLKSGGIYILEDLHTSLSDEFIGLGEKTTLNILKNWPKTKSEYLTEEEHQYLMNNIDKIDIIYTINKDGKESITSLIYKK